jgi:hypothetical protein
MEDLQYWPFPIETPEDAWDEFDRDTIGFMNLAFVEGMRPRCNASCSMFEIGTWGDGRSASLVFRGQTLGWEPFLGEHEQRAALGTFFHLPLGECACVCVRPPFRDAAYLALEWVRGRALDTLLAEYRFMDARWPGLIRK